MGFGNISDIFEYFFGGGFSPGQSGRNREYQPGENLHRSIHLKLEDCLEDYSTELKVQRRETCEACGGSRAEPGSQPETCQTCGGQGVVLQVRDTLLGRMQSTSTCPHCQGMGYTISTPCKSCRGSGFKERERKIEVTVPAGIDDGNVLRIGGQGHSGRGGGPAGDLLVSITVEPHASFQRRGADLYVELPVHYADLVLGTTVTVETLYGEEQLRIPAGTQSHHVFQMRGMGLPRCQRSGKGELHVRAILSVPRRLNKQQRELLNQLREQDIKADKKAGGILYRLLNRK